MQRSLSRAAASTSPSGVRLTASTSSSTAPSFGRRRDRRGMDDDVRRPSRARAASRCAGRAGRTRRCPSPASARGRERRRRRHVGRDDVARARERPHDREPEEAGGARDERLHAAVTRRPPCADEAERHVRGDRLAAHAPRAGRSRRRRRGAARPRRPAAASAAGTRSAPRRSGTRARSVRARRRRGPAAAS